MAVEIRHGEKTLGKEVSTRLHKVGKHKVRRFMRQMAEKNPQVDLGYIAAKLNKTRLKRGDW